MKKQYVIPIFIPQNDSCIFSNLNLEKDEAKQITKENVRKTIEQYIKDTKENTSKEVAFVGGSFLAMKQSMQEELLSLAYEYIQSGKVNSIRILTSPKDVNKQSLSILKKYKVKTVELAVQSTNNYILNRANIDHTFEEVKRASKLIRWKGFVLGHQMIVGLPDSTKLDELNTAKELIKLKPKIIRIYPLLLIKQTAIAKEYEQGEYEPLTLVQAVERCKELVYLFNKKHIKVIRIGIETTSEQTVEMLEKQIVAGPFHPAFGQLVEASIWYDSIVDKIKKFNVKVKEAQIQINPEDEDNVVGYEKENIIKLQELYDVDLSIVKDEKIKIGKSEITILKTYSDFLEENEKEKIVK